MIHNLNKEIIHTIDSYSMDDILDYTVTINGNEVYRGTVLGNAAYVDIDIAPIVRGWHQHTFEHSLHYMDSVRHIGKIMEVVVNSNDEDTVYRCTHNYNIDGEEYSDNVSLISRPIKPVLSSKQKLYLTFYNSGDRELKLKISNKSGVIKTIDVRVSDWIYNYGFDLSEVKFKYNDYIKIEYDGKTTTYNVLMAGCSNMFVIHYKNIRGGMDCFLMEGKQTVSYNNKDISIHTGSNLTERWQHNERILSREAFREYNLNTGILSDKQSERMPDFLLSTEHWIEDLSTGELRSVVLKSNSQQIKTFKTDKYVNYDLIFEDNNKYIIK